MTRPDLNRARWELLERLYWEARDLPDDARAAFFGHVDAPADVIGEVAAMLAVGDEHDGMRVERRFVTDDGDGADGLAPGTMIGAYRLIELVGRGGMGEVYRAQRADGALDLEVALKLLRADARASAVTRRFHAERALLARLSHPHIASILDAGTAFDGRPYLVLRFVHGEPITQAAARLDLPARLRLFLKVAEAVQFAHANLIVHRDIKPSNILVTASGDPVLLDFGIAKLLGDDPLGTGDTGLSERVMTPSYASPEQLRGGPVTTATDVYGLGALLFEVLTGVPPFAAARRRLAEMEQDILETPAPLPSAMVTDSVMRAQIRGDLDSIVQMALRKEPERRYPTAGQFADDVQRYLRGLPVRAETDRWSYRTRRFVQRHRTPVAAACMFVTLLGVLFARERVQSRRLRIERDRAVAERAAGDDVLAFLTSLFEQSDPRVVPGADTLRVAPFLTGAEARVASLSDQPERQVRLYRALGNARFSRGDYAVADSLLTLAVAIGGKALGADHLEVLRTREMLVEVLTQRRGDQSARPMSDSVLRALLRTVGPNHPDVANAYARLAAVTPDAALVSALLDSSVALQVRSGRIDSVGIAAMFSARARARGLQHSPRRAAALEEAALRIMTPRLAADHSIMLTLKGNLAIWLAEAGDWQRALSLAREVLSVARRNTTAGHGLALAYERVALVAVNIPGQLPLAGSMSRLALSTLRGTVAPEHPLIASSMRNLAIILAQEGRLVAGLALLDSAIAKVRTAADTSGWQYMTGQRVPMLVALGRVAEAERSAAFARVARAREPLASDRVALIDWQSGMAAMAAGRAADAVPLFQRVIDADRGADSASLRWWRGTMATCAIGVAVNQSARGREARVQTDSTCPALDRWGRADPTVRAWWRTSR